MRPVIRGPLAERLDAHLRDAAAAGFSGAVLLAHGDTVLLHQGYGLADREHGVPVTPETAFDIGSVTKPFTAAAILRLQEEGLLSVDDPITRFFSDVPEDKREITVHHLLTHSAGLLDALGGDYEVAPRDSVVRLAMASDLAWVPGTRYRYSNVGYTLLGAIVERVSGLGYETYLREHVLLPAGMEKTGYVLPGWAEADVAVGYKDGEQWGRPTEKPWADDGPYWHLRANGGLIAPLADLYRWDRALMRGNVLSSASQALMFTPHVPENADSSSFYGYGWTLFTTARGTRLAAHDGGNAAFFADVRRYLDEEVVILWATNDASPYSQNLYRQLVRSVWGGTWEPYVAPVVADIDTDVYDDYVGLYQIAPAGEVEVTRDGDRLFIHPPEQSREELLPQSATRFFARSAPNVIIEFVHDAAGTVEALVVHQNGGITRAERGDG
ncbi:MAG TPA: serine hydrolase [Rubricoccaceae bacterium]|jgi:CubicO group peptidase (beta-lactamase class C family)